MPEWPRNILRACPPWLAPFVNVVSGDMIREDVQEAEVGREHWNEEEYLTRRIVRTGRLYSPAVTLGTFVLTGWSGADLK